MMTDKQRRYLLQLLAEDGVEEEMALGELRRIFEVEDLAEVTASRASWLIEEFTSKAAPPREGNGGAR